MLLRGPQGFMLMVSFGVSMVLLTLARFEQGQQLDAGSIGGTMVVADTSLVQPSPLIITREEELVLTGGGGAAASPKADGMSDRRSIDSRRVLPGAAAESVIIARAPQPEWLQESSSHLWSAQYRAAMRHLYTRLNPEVCSTATVMRIPIGRGGGFGSMFQWSAKMFSAVLTEPSLTVAIYEGQLKAYTSNDRCRTLVPSAGWPCFYEQLSNCTAKSGASSKRFGWGIRGDAQKAEYRSLEPGVVASMPAEFTPEGAGFWWGALQGYSGRLNARMRDRLAAVKQELGYYGVGDRAPELAMHIRLGDKQGDAQSKQSGVAGAAADYFKQADIIVAKVQRVECGTGANLNTAGCAQVGVFIATDSAAAVAASRAWAASNPAVRLVIAAATSSQNVSAGAGEVAKLIGKRDDAYEIAEEVVLDLNLLLEAPHFVGLCMSQLARYVVGVGFARGTLKTAIAMDHTRITKKDQFKLGVEDVPWQAPSPLQA